MTEQPRILIALEAGISIGSMNDISNAVASTFGAGGLILTEDDVSSEFFDLKTGLAGELFQTFKELRTVLGHHRALPGTPWGTLQRTGAGTQIAQQNSHRSLQR